MLLFNGLHTVQDPETKRKNVYKSTHEKKTATAEYLNTQDLQNIFSKMSFLAIKQSVLLQLMHTPYSNINTLFGKNLMYTNTS